MAAAATNTYSGSGIIPCWAPAEALTDAVVLKPGTYAAGTVLGQYTVGASAANNAQTITVTGTPTGGSFLIYFDGYPITIPYNASLAAIQALLDAVPSIGAGNTVVSGSGALPGNVITITAAANLAGRNLPSYSLGVNGLTGGTNPAAALAVTVAGNPAGSSYAAYSDAASDGLQVAKCILMNDTVVDTFGNHYSGGGEWTGTKATAPIAGQRTAPVWIKGYFKTKELTGIDANGVADLGRMARGNTGALTVDIAVLAMF